jgi:hypothetical protein
VVQPSANNSKWDGPWPSDPGQIEGEVWRREGLAKKLVGRENLRYGINPMLVVHPVRDRHALRIESDLR